jgi:hypothetical protein
MDKAPDSSSRRFLSGNPTPLNINLPKCFSRFAERDQRGIVVNHVDTVHRRPDRLSIANVTMTKFSVRMPLRLFPHVGDPDALTLSQQFPRNQPPQKAGPSCN